MSDINRFSSRRQRLDHAFLSDRLKGAKSYKRIAGYFRSSIFELVGEEIAAIPKVQIVCNSELDAADVAVSKHVRETALKERWNEAPSEVEALLHRDRYRRLHDLLTQRSRRDSRGAEGPRLHPRQGGCHREPQTARRPASSAPSTKPRAPLRRTTRSCGKTLPPKASPGSRRSSSALWKDAYPLPDAIIEEIKRVADRVEIRFERHETRGDCRPPRWPKARSTAAASSSSRGSARS